MKSEEKILDKIKKIIPVPDKSIYNYTWSLAVFFVLSVFFGIYTAYVEPEETAKLFEQIMTEYSELGEAGPVTLFLIIFFNNIIITFVMMMLGIFFSLTPIFFVWANGFIFGLAAPTLSSSLGIITVALGILPHGIIEIPAALLSAGYGIWLGKKSYRTLRYKEPLLPSIRQASRGYFQYILPLFFVAAFIEAFFTKFILDKIINLAI